MLAIFLNADIGTDRAPAYFLWAEKNHALILIYFRLERVPFEKILEHGQYLRTTPVTTASMLNDSFGYMGLKSLFAGSR